MKKCCTCHQWLDKSEFNKRKAAWDGLQSRCRGCCRAWYEAHKQEHIATARARTRSVKVVNRQLMHRYLLQHPCVDCGETDIRVLDFDHREGEKKAADVGRLLGNGFAWSTILAEIAKCDVRCSNCHRIVTCQRANNWRQKVMGEDVNEDAETPDLLY